MSKTKEKKIKKLRDGKIWLHLLGMILVLVVYVAVTLFGLELSVGSVYSSKALQCYCTALDVKRAYEARSAAGDVQEVMQDALSNFLGVKNICIADANGTIISKYGDYGSEMENVIDVQMYLKEADYEDIGEILVDEMDYNDLLTRFLRLDFIAKKVDEGLYSIDDIDFWYKLPLSGKDGSIYIQTTMRLYLSDVLVLFSGFGINTILAVLIIIWNIISIIRLFGDRRKLAKLFYTDAVTGGYNMHYFYDRVRAVLKENHRGRNYAIVDMKMVKYRNFCTCYGVEEGMELIEKIYDTLSSVIGKKEVLAHTEKADFALLLQYESQESLIKRLENIAESLKDVYPGQKINFNMGIYSVPKGNLDVECMYNYAGLPLSSMPADSDQRICWYDDAMKQNQQWERMVENDMQRALDEKEFQVYLQPKYSTKDEKLAGAEALVRWQHPTEGLLSPYKFIPIFEKNGFILKLDDYMITEIARQQAKWISEGKKVVPISVNVSRAHFTKSNLAEHICGLIDQFHVPHDVIELELTESAFFDDKQVLIDTVKKLQNYGFDVSMDDFGSGYSSLNSLKELPLDVLKLDAEFFRGDDAEGRGDVIVGEAITLAKKLDMRIVAEGIETREQVDFLADKDCDLIQGYYFAKPMPILEFEEKAFPLVCM